MAFQPQQQQQEQRQESLFNEFDPNLLNGSSPAAMEFQSCVVCSFDIVEGGYEFDCGHQIHEGCFDTFVSLEDLECHDCATAQWYYGGGYVEPPEEPEQIIQQIEEETKA